MPDKFPLKTLLEVEWEDITTFNQGWMSAAEAKKESALMPIRTVGYLLEETPKLLKLTMMMSPTNDGEVGVTAVIPKGVIKRMKTLKGL